MYRLVSVTHYGVFKCTELLGILSKIFIRFVASIMKKNTHPIYAFVIKFT